MYIPGSDPLAPPMPISTSESHGSGTGNSTTFSESHTSGTSRSVVPWYEYHKTTELTSREFMNLEEQLYRKKAQLKKLPSQHYAFLMPEQNVQILKAGTLKGQSDLTTDRQRQEFLEEAFTHAGCFSTPEEVEQEQQAIERSLMADRPPITLVESSEETQSATKKGRGATPASKRGARRKPQPKSNPTIFDHVSFDPNDPNQSGEE